MCGGLGPLGLLSQANHSLFTARAYNGVVSRGKTDGGDATTERAGGRGIQFSWAAARNKTAHQQPAAVL